jgi:acyl-CoA synthetase (AMP-forming)/AMP-acid ligase II
VTGNKEELYHGKIADYKKPKSLNFIDDMPRNPSGKILKRVLRDPYWKDREHKVLKGKEHPLYNLGSFTDSLNANTLAY